MSSRLLQLIHSTSVDILHRLVACTESLITKFEGQFLPTSLHVGLASTFNVDPILADAVVSAASFNRVQHRKHSPPVEKVVGVRIALKSLGVIIPKSWIRIKPQWKPAEKRATQPPWTDIVWLPVRGPNGKSINRGKWRKNKVAYCACSKPFYVHTNFVECEICRAAIVVRQR